MDEEQKAALELTGEELRAMREAAKPAAAAKGPRLSAHVPIRFPPEVIAKVRVLASRENKTVSTWIRDVVEREVERRFPVPRREATAAVQAYRIDIGPVVGSGSVGAGATGTVRRRSFHESSVVA